MKPGSAKTLAGILIISFVATISAAEIRAVLYPAAGVFVNGIEVRSSSAISGGDKIKTAAFPAELTGKNWLVKLFPDTTLEIGDTLQLGCGGLLVNGEQVIETTGVVVVPTLGARFEVVNQGDLRISVHSGSVQIKGEKKETVSEGHSITRAGSPGCRPLAEQKTPKSKSGKKAAVIGGAGAGGSIILFEMMKGKETAKPISPDRP